MKEKRIVKCFSCGKLCEVSKTGKEWAKNRKVFCSRSCANSRDQTQTLKEAKCTVCGKSTTAKKNASLATVLCSDCRDKKTFTVCSTCGKKIRKNESGKCRRCLERDPAFRKKISNSNKGKTGGYHEGSVKSYKSGRFNGIWFDSSWELAFYLFHKDEDIIRNSEGFPYIFKGTKHLYYPDFQIGNTYYEIKGFEDETVKVKLEQFPGKIVILRSKEMKPILKQIELEFGSDFISLYD
jgi:hypothetical protein